MTTDSEMSSERWNFWTWAWFSDRKTNL